MLKKYLFRLRTLNKLGVEGMYQYDEATRDRHMANTVLSGEKLKTSPLRSETRMLTLATFSNIAPEGLARAVRQEKEIKVIYIEKVEIKLSWFVDNMV
jgi:hypothetical protein